MSNSQGQIVSFSARSAFSAVSASAFFLTVLVASIGLRPQTPEKIKPSQHGSVMQQVANTEITIEYNRPVARGRELFGGIVGWGRIWNPGADQGTSIALSTPVRVNGQ